MIRFSMFIELVMKVLIRLRGCARPFSGAYIICDKLRPKSAIANITKTRLYNFDPLKPHFYIVKLEFTGVYIIFLN